MVRKGLILKIFDAANMQRWNDKIRPVELRELDKQAHKMVIAYVLGKFEEDRPGFDWIEVIEGGLFEFLQRLVITDLKPQIFYEIEKDREKYRQLNEWVYSRLSSVISPLGEDFGARFRAYFGTKDDTPGKRVLRAAHFYATKWEFDIIERANPGGYEIADIKKDLQARQEMYADLRGVRELALYERYRNFVDLCGQLRFQLRWSHLHRVPKTSVLGHMLTVAVFTYLFSLEIGACRLRRINNYLTGLFHDLPEVLTRDIISPVKKSVEGLEELIKGYEKERMDREVYALIPGAWHKEMRLFTEDEFGNIVTVDGRTVRTTPAEINASYNEDRFSPRDGEIVKAADDLAAFVEAYLGLENGIRSAELEESKGILRQKYRRTNVGGVNIGEIYADFG